MTTTDTMICGLSRDAFLDRLSAFHGFTAPGLVLGGFMVDEAQHLIRTHMGPNVEADAIVETRHCLPDAIQIFTPCTIGNGWLKILDWGKFALSLYDKHSLNGFRVWFDISKAAQFPNLYNWYMRRVSKKDLPIDVLLASIFEAGKDALSSKAVSITQAYSRAGKGDTAVCPGCGEVYPTAQGGQCAACQGDAYYKIVQQK